MFLSFFSSRKRLRSMRLGLGACTYGSHCRLRVLLGTDRPRTSWLSCTLGSTTQLTGVTFSHTTSRHEQIYFEDSDNGTRGLPRSESRRKLRGPRFYRALSSRNPSISISESFGVSLSQSLSDAVVRIRHGLPFPIIFPLSRLEYMCVVYPPSLMFIQFLITV